MFEQTTSLDYNIKCQLHNNNFTNNIEVIRSKNSTNFQTKMPMKEVRFIIDFSPSEIARVEISK